MTGANNRLIVDRGLGPQHYQPRLVEVEVRKKGLNPFWAMGKVSPYMLCYYPAVYCLI